MPYIEWKDSLSLNVESIDNEHKHLILLANKLIAAAKDNDMVLIKNVFHELREYTIFHFNNEELYMNKILYPGITKHEEEHALLKKQVKQFQDNYYRQIDIDSKNVFEFIKHWLIDHVLCCDLEIKNYIEKQSSSENTEPKISEQRDVK